ncbi:MAG TPA: DUF445 domain-containing protein [Stellaceae bacterium]|nr:DUF445 domain-containing protein [Stellaceae bacterium]
MSSALPSAPLLAPPADPERVRRLRRAKLVATGLLAVTAGLFLLAHRLPLSPFWRDLIGSAGEAGTVGGLADWFAVTALFRRPLGLPIPHTALIATRKDEIARSIATFIEGHFLAPEPLLARLRDADRGQQLGAWLAQPETASKLATALARTVRALVRRGRHLDVVDSILLPALRWVAPELRRFLPDAIGKHTGWLMPRLIDRSLARKLADEADRLIEALGRPGSSERLSFDTWLRTRMEEIPADLRAVGTKLLDEIDAGTDSDDLTRTIAEALTRLGHFIEGSPEARGWINASLENFLLDYLADWRSSIGRYIEGIIQGWDAAQVTRIIELQVGRDLQFVRLNGTLIGALIGIGLFLIAHWSRLAI